MRPNTFRSIAEMAVLCTTIVMFFGIGVVAPILKADGLVEQLGGGLVAALSSIGVYRLVSAVLWWAFRRQLWVRRLVLGRNFVEGTWVGYYKTDKFGDVVTIETYDQESGELAVQGRELDAIGATLSHWKSNSASLSADGEQVTFAYDCDVFSRKGQHSGVAVFRLLRLEKNSPPATMDGHATDFTDGVKDVNRQKKISDGLVELDTAFRKARDLFGLTKS